jgi:L-fuconolactonase
MTETGAIRRIDAHHHVWDLAVRDQPWTNDIPSLHRTFTVDELRPQLAAAGVTGTVLVQTVTVAEETPEFLALAAQNPEILGVVGWVDLTAPDCADRLAELNPGPGGDRLVGIRHQVQGEADPRWLLRDDVTRGLRAVAAAGLAYDLLVTPEQLPVAVEIVRRMDSVRFVLDHAGNPDIAHGGHETWRVAMRALAALPNVDVKLSGLLTRAADECDVQDIRPYTDTLLDLFGGNRVMFGSDWPVSTLRVDYARVVDVTDELLDACTGDERASVFAGTAIRSYRLAAS